MKNNAVKMIFGTVFLILGLIGLLLPVIPQIPFLAASAVFFASGSERMRKKILNNHLYKKYLSPFIEKSPFLRRFSGLYA